MSLLPLLLSRIRRHGPLTMAQYMELALYHPEHGYYVTADRRTGRDGDFYTSVDVGPLFGELIAVQLAEMWELLRRTGATTFDLVEAGAGNGRLARDILDSAVRHYPDLYAHLRLTLVERGAAARAAQPAVLGPHVTKLVGETSSLPRGLRGVVIGNELLDALPVHVVTMTSSGQREIGVGEHEGRLVEVEMPLSDALLERWSGTESADIPGGDRAEIALEARDWIRDASAALECGFVLLFDYGHGRTADRSGDTLMAYRAHRGEPSGWFARPGETDLTSHVDFEALCRTAVEAGFETLGLVDQTYFLLGLGLAERVQPGDDRRALKQRLEARTLVMPGGLGSTMKALGLAKGIGRPRLRGFASGRLT